MNGKHRMNNGSGSGHNKICKTYIITGNKGQDLMKSKLSADCRVQSKNVNESNLWFFPHLYFLIYSMSFTLKIMKNKGSGCYSCLFVIQSSRIYFDYLE